MKNYVWVLLLSLGACGTVEGSLDPTAVQADALRPGAPCIVDAVVVRDFGHVVYQGDIDLASEVARIVHGERLPYHHDGSVFRNREHRLPAAPDGYYHEYVHPTAGIRGPGPQRLVRGGEGEIDYTPDHYATFILLDAACAAAVTARLFADPSMTDETAKSFP